MFYAVKITDKMFLTTSLLAFNKREAAEASDGYHIFANSDELAESQFNMTELRGIHYSVTGFETAVSDRLYLCDILFEAIQRSQIGAQDDDEDFPAIEQPEEVQSIEPDFLDTEEEVQPIEPVLPDLPPEPRITLTDAPKIKYSKRERAIFNFIASRHPEAMTTKQIGERVIKDDHTFHVQTTTVITLKSLNKKMAYNSEPFTLKFTGHSGPKPMKVSLEERKM